MQFWQSNYRYERLHLFVSLQTQAQSLICSSELDTILSRSFSKEQIDILIFEVGSVSQFNY